MISLKKAVFAVGVATAAAAHASVLPDCFTCQAYLEACDGGDRAACTAYNEGKCGLRFPANVCEL